MTRRQSPRAYAKDRIASTDKVLGFVKEVRAGRKTSAPEIRGKLEFLNRWREWFGTLPPYPEVDMPREAVLAKIDGCIADLKELFDLLPVDQRQSNRAIFKGPLAAFALFLDGARDKLTAFENGEHPVEAGLIDLILKTVEGSRAHIETRENSDGDDHELLIARASAILIRALALKARTTNRTEVTTPARVLAGEIFNELDPAIASGTEILVRATRDGNAALVSQTTETLRAMRRQLSTIEDDPDSACARIRTINEQIALAIGEPAPDDSAEESME